MLCMMEMLIGDLNFWRCFLTLCAMMKIFKIRSVGQMKLASD